jgi:hypothetical protein
MTRVRWGNFSPAAIPQEQKHRAPSTDWEARSAMRFHNDVATYVAHYTRSDTALDLILKNNSLRLGPLYATNDPRETKSWSFAVGGTWSEDVPEGLNLDELVKKYPDYNRIIRSGCRILCASEDTEKAFKLDIHDRSYGKPRMWAQYAGNHTGVCLIFDKTALHKDIQASCGPREALMSGNVEYGDFFAVSNTRNFPRYMEAFSLSGNSIVTEGLEPALLRHRDAYSDVFFFQKNKDWEHENEYRSIIRGDSDIPIFIPIQNCLRAILLGTDFPDAHLDEVHRYCIRYDAALARVLWFNGRPILDWVPADQIRGDTYAKVVGFYRLLPST